MLTEHAIRAGSLLLLFFSFIICLFLFSKAVKLKNREKNIYRQEQALAKRQLALDARFSEQKRTDAVLIKRASELSSKEAHIDDIIRSKTISMAYHVASRKYLRNTPAFSCICNPDSPHISQETYQRLLSSLTNSFHIGSPFDISAKIVSESGNSYRTTLYSCNCSDFQFRKSPCKHMLRLALESGLLLNFDTVALKSEVSNLLSKREELLKESSEIQQRQRSLSKQESDFKQLIQETKQSYPWLAAHYADLLSTYDNEIYRQLLIKARNIGKVKELKKQLQNELRFWRTSAKKYQYQLDFYETLFPWLLSFKEVPPIEAFEYASAISTVPQEEQEFLRKYLSPDEYINLSDSEKDQLSLERYLSRKKSSWDIGIEYERYIGYLCESAGYIVHYTGATRKLEDMGRDLILEKDTQTILVQCKRWAKEKTIHENHVFQLAGSTYEYQSQHPNRQVIGIFVSTIDFSPVAVRCAELLGLQLFPQIPFQEYPRIKCNVRKNENGEIQKIYHLPMDQQYDKVKINNPGEFYAWTVEEAQKAGFRRAHRWRGTKQE